MGAGINVCFLKRSRAETNLPFLAFAFQSNTIPIQSKVSSDLHSSPVNSHNNGIKELDIDGEIKLVYQTERPKWPPMDKIISASSDKSVSHGGRSPADSVDKASRALFPAFFVIYNIVYWAVYAMPE